MTNSPRAWMSWSSGKDSAFALDQIRAAGELDIRTLLVTINADAERVAMHAVRLTLLDAQADRLGIPRHLVEIPQTCPNDVYEALITCVDPRVLSAEFVGRDFDAAFLADLPDGVDPCGERGEFHTFVWDGPDFATPIEIARGDTVERDGFVFCDVISA